MEESPLVLFSIRHNPHLDCHRVLLRIFILVLKHTNSALSNSSTGSVRVKPRIYDSDGFVISPYQRGV
jgi:hypothetical protein